MSKITADIYSLLPQVIRYRDEQEGWPLRALFNALQKSAQLVEQDIEQLYDNHFIETCEEWVVPYIADLVGVGALHEIEGARFSNRARVGNTLAYRRRKGTITMLEQLARDCTGWGAAAAEMFHLAGWTLNINHLSWRPLRTPDFHDTNALELLGKPFDKVTTTIDVRSPDLGLRAVNVPNLVIFLWRLYAYPVVEARAKHLGGVGSRTYTFDPTGRSVPLFNQSKPEETITHVAEERNVPGRLRRRALYEELLTTHRDYFANPGVISVWLDGQVIPAEKIQICNLDSWPLLTDTTKMVAVDPERGRLTLGFDDAGNLIASEDVFVSYSYGFPGDLGGGPYLRQSENLDVPEWQVAVPIGNSTTTDEPTINDAISAWHTVTTETTSGRIVVTDSDTYAEDLDPIKIAAEQKLTLLAAEWPFPREDEAIFTREIAEISADDVRPIISSDIVVEGLPSDEQTGGSFAIDGFWVEGNILVLAGELNTLSIRHSTLIPGASTGNLKVFANEKLEITLYRCVFQSISVDPAVESLTLIDCIVLGDIVARGSKVEITRCSIFGQTRALHLEADASIFMKKVTVAKLQEGCVRFCYLPSNSRCPRRYRCQPDLALGEVSSTSPKGRQISLGLVPTFVTTEWGQPEFATLTNTTACEILQGSEDGCEMGAWSFLKNAHREVNLRASLEEYVRYGMNAGLLFVD